MNTTSAETPYADHERRRFRRGTILLSSLAIAPFVFMFVMPVFNAFGLYLSPLVFMGLCPLGLIGYPIIAHTEIKLIWRYLGSREDSKRLTTICYGLSVAGFVAPLVLMGLIWGYIVLTFLSS
jgi:hypothetical protein